LLARWHNDVLIEAAVLHTLRDRGAESTIALLDALAGEKDIRRVGLRALAELTDWSQGRHVSGTVELDAAPFFARIPVWWKSAPELRPTLLYLLVRIGEHREGAIAWPKLAQFLGRPIAAEELTGFFAEDARNVWYLPALAGGLGSGWSRSRAFIPGIEAYLDAAAENKVRYSIRQTVERVVGVLCETGSRADVVEVQSVLKNRAQLFPSQQRELGSFIRQKPDELCPHTHRRHTERNERPTLFAD
jgi:hypothetical protein